MWPRFSEEIETILREAGWHPGRSAFPAALPADYTLFPIAQRALEEFGGLHVGTCGMGTDFARSDILFEPDLGEGLARHISQTPEGRRIYPLGEVQHGHSYLFIDEAGVPYLYSVELRKCGDNLDEGLISTLLGIRISGLNRWTITGL